MKQLTGANFNKLVKRVGQCADDGICCDVCKAEKVCVRFWDDVVCETTAQNKDYKEFRQRLDEFRDLKYETKR